MDAWGMATYGYDDKPIGPGLELFSCSLVEPLLTLVALVALVAGRLWNHVESGVLNVTLTMFLLENMSPS